MEWELPCNDLMLLAAASEAGALGGNHADRTGPPPGSTRVSRTARGCAGGPTWHHGAVTVDG